MRKIFSILIIIIFILIYAIDVYAQEELEIYINEIYNEILRIDTDQIKERLTIDKYKYIPPYTIDNITYEIHEYTTPSSEVGYQIYITQELEQGIYKKSINTGIESYRNYDWQLIKDLTYEKATTTPIN